MSDPESVMPDRELPPRVRRRLSSALEDGARLSAPLPSQAVYASSRGVVPAPRWRLRALTVAVAAVGIVAVALAGPPQSREWLAQSVNDISRQVGVPASKESPSPSGGGETKSGQQPSTHESPEASEPPEATESNEPNESPQPAASPQPSESPDGDGEHPQASPTPTPKPSDDGGDDHSPEPTPSS